MRNPRILNRPMFNRNNSAYGRGIASNLVSEEERQRFNYGGRVGLAQGVGKFNWAPSNVEDIERLPSGEIDYGYYEKEDLKVPTSWGERIIPMWPFYGREEQEKKFFESSRKEKEAKKAWEESGIFPGETGYLGKTPPKEEIITAVEDDTGKTQLEKDMADADAGEADAALKRGTSIKKDPDSDQLYTDEEQKEKKSQMALAIAGRLIGGSRDKWGSKAQMENIAGGLEDIRKIADPSERRDMLAKYEAWGKARTKETLASLREQQKISKQATQEAIKDKEAQYTSLWTSGKVDKNQAANMVYFDGTITTISKADSKKKKDWEENPEKYPGPLILITAPLYSSRQPSFLTVLL